MAALSSKKQGGFDCELIKNPPEDFQYECPVCLLVLREPHQVTCCGYAFCRVCIERVQLQKSGCPTCKMDEFSVFPDKRLQRSLYAYRVRCSHKNDGCQWTSQLGELDKHLNENPKLSEQLSGCKFTEIECQHCTHLFQRRYISAHETAECAQRPFTCDYCKDYESTYEDVGTNHWLQCPFYPVSCPNKCGDNPKRQNLEDHVSKDCPLTVVNCDFHYAGCEVQLPRKDMPAHLAENMVVHTTKLVTSMQEKIQALTLETRALRNTLTEKELEIADLKTKQVQLKARQEEDHSSLRAVQAELSHLHVLPVELTMTEFKKHKQVDDAWFSEPFYTHLYGHKMCLMVNAKGWYTARGTHVSAYVCLMRGQFDEDLKWPFCGKITVQMINYRNENQHCTNTADFSRAISSKNGRVTKQETVNDRRYGWHDFIPHSELGYDPAKNRQFLKDDCLHFRVTQVAT